MSHIHDGPLATYNSLTDPNLAGFFGNTRMRKHLKKSGLINRRGEIISENQYRLNMARKEHKKHVKDLLAQAIVHKTLDLERYRQVEIKKKLEEIAKIEMVRRVRSSRGRKGDEEVLPYLSPRSMSRPHSGIPKQSTGRGRPKSAPAPPRDRQHSHRSGYTDPYDDVIYVDDEGRPISPPPPSDRPSFKDSLREVRSDNIDTRHLYALDSEALQQYAQKLSRSERGRDGATSPYLISQIPQPPKHGRNRSARSSPRRSARMSARPQSSKKPGVRGGEGSPHSDGTLMLHRQEPAMMHQGEVQTLCEITMKYHGPNLTLPRDQFDPTQEVSIEQQHCGGNTLPVFKERLQAGSTFSFISRRHRGYPFSLTLYIDGRVDCRVSTCCEYKHAVGVRLGGKMGHFSLTGINGATPCYKCKLSCQAPPRILKFKKSGTRVKKQTPSTDEEVTVEGTPRTPITQKSKEQDVSGKSDEDKYEDDFEEDEAKDDKYEDDFEEEDAAVDKRHIIGLHADESRVNGKTVSVDVAEKDKEAEEEGTLPEHRRIEGYSSEDEDTEGPKKGSVEVTAIVHSTKKEPIKRRSRTSSSSSSSSLSSTSSDKRSPRPKSQEEPKYVTETQTKVDVTSARSDTSAVPRSDRTDRSTTSSGSLTTETETTMETNKKEEMVSKRRSSSSSSSSTLTSDSEDEKYQRKKHNEKVKRENELKAEEERRREAEEREAKRVKETEEQEKKRKEEQEERTRRFELQRQESQERLRAMEERRKMLELERQEKNAEQMRAKEEERRKREEEEERMRRDYEKQLSFIQSQRDSESTMSVTDTTVSEEPKVQTTSEIKKEPAEQKRRSTTSSSSDSERSSESEAEKMSPFQAAIASTKGKGPEPVKEEEKVEISSSPASNEPQHKETVVETKVVEEKKLERRSSTSSTSSSSSSSSGGEYALPKSSATHTEEKEIMDQKPESESSSGSSSESDDDNKNVETPKTEEVKVDVPKKVEEEVKPATKSSSSSSSSSGSSTESESEASQKPQPVQTLAKVQEDVKESSPPAVKDTKAVSEDSESDSSSSDSETSSSDSEDDKKDKSSKTTEETSLVTMTKPRPPAKHFGSILPMMKGSNSIDLSGVRLDDQQLKEISNYLMEMDNIKSVTLRNAGIDDDEFQVVAYSLQNTKSCPNLLNFSLNRLTERSMQELSKAIKNKPSISVIILNGNPIRDAGCKAVLDALTKTKDPFPFLRRSSGYLTPTQARDQDLTTGDYDVVSGTSETGIYIKELYFGDCNLSDEGIGEISKFLESNKTLEVLSLSGSTVDVTPAGWLRLGQALSKNRSLKTLSLDYTNLGDQGFDSLAQGLRTNMGLKCLEMVSAGLTERGGETLKGLLKSNTYIQQVTAMPGNSISNATMEEIRKYLALNKTSSDEL